MSLEESLKTVKPFTARTDFTEHVPREGISLQFILKYFGDLANVRTMYDLEEYILKITKKNHCSFAELLQHHEAHKHAVVGSAKYFVSFAYSTEMETILDALEKYRRKVAAEDLYVWISILTVNQHFGRSEGEEAAIEYPKSWFKNAFETCISSIQNVLFIMSPIAQPVALQRLWCIYELYLTVLYPTSVLDVCLAEDDESEFMTGLLSNTESLLEYINGVNAEKAKSSNPAQEAKLRARIEAMPGGYEKINTEVREKLRLWFAHTAQSFIEVNKQEYVKDKARYINLVLMVGKMFLETGKLVDAEPLLHEALREAKAHYGNDHRECVFSADHALAVHKIGIKCIS